jgi:hypothetical protein
LSMIPGDVNDRSRDSQRRDNGSDICKEKRKYSYLAVITIFLPEFFAEYKASSALCIKL